MNKGETIFQKWVFRIVIIFKMFLPPLFSLKRLEPVCKKWLAKNPKAYTPRKFLAGLYALNDRNEEARREYSYLQGLGYLTVKDKLYSAEVLVKLKDYQGVVDLLLPLTENQFDEFRTNKYLGRSFLLLGFPEKGLEHFERVKNSKKFKWDDYKDLGVCYYDLKRYEEALTNLEKALALSPQSQVVQEMIGVVYSQRGEEFIKTDLARAEEDLTKSLNYWPTSQAVRKVLTKVQEMRRGSV